VSGVGERSAQRGGPERRVKKGRRRGSLGAGVSSSTGTCARIIGGGAETSVKKREKNVEPVQGKVKLGTRQREKNQKELKCSKEREGGTVPRMGRWTRGGQGMFCHKHEKHSRRLCKAAEHA